jgi:predicted RNase H-like nuclease (RuvC/YqgF family)
MSLLLQVPAKEHVKRAELVALQQRIEELKRALAERETRISGLEVEVSNMKRALRDKGLLPKG